MPRLTVRPLTASDTAIAAGLLARRQRRDRARLPMLAAALEQPAGCEKLVAALLLVFQAMDGVQAATVHLALSGPISDPEYYGEAEIAGASLRLSGTPTPIDALNLHHSDWTLGTVTLVHRFGVRALAWDAQEMRHLLRALRFGVDGVFSDRVDRMLAAVGEWSAGIAPT